MFEEKLNDMYKNADQHQLLKAWKKADEYENKSLELSRKANSICSKIKDSICNRFINKTEEHTQDIYHIGETQIQEMLKQWRLVSASMVKVKRTVALPGFYSEGSLYINPRYGVKEHKKYSGWQPFHVYDLKSMAKEHNEALYEIHDSRLYLINSTLDFNVLGKIPQLDQERVKMLIKITYDMIEIFNSWLDFFGQKNHQFMKDYDLIRNLSNKYVTVPNMRFITIIEDLPRLEKLRDTIEGKLKEQSNKWKPTLEKWQANNKNFVVLNKLAKIDIKI